MHIAVDFAETLVKERPMIEWVLFELRNTEYSIWRRFRFIINSFARGSISIVFGRVRITSKWAAKVAYMSFKGISQERLQKLINHRNRDNIHILSLNMELVDVLLRLREEYGVDPTQPLDISIHSQGTCTKAIELFMQRQDVIQTLGQTGFNLSEIVANQLEVINGRFTGQLVKPIITKYNKPGTIPEDSIFIGDKHDEKSINRMSNRNFRFIRL
jgi:hypothetical protein